MVASTNSLRLRLLAMVLFNLSALSLTAQAANAPQTNVRGGYRIAGTVVSKIDTRPLSHARITLRDVTDVQKIRSMLTEDNGKFEFSGLPAGKYSLSGAKRGFITASYDQHEDFSTAIVTGAGVDTETLVLRLTPAAVIAGRVLDESGDPVRRAMVTLYVDDHTTGVDQIHQLRTAPTDDLGAYEMTPLTPGTYFVSASAKPWYAVHPNSDARGQQSDTSAIDRSLDVAYPTTYYADVTDSDSATPIPIQGGERLQVDIHLNPVPALHLFFRAPGDGRRGAEFPELQQSAFDGSTSVQGTSEHMVSPGVVEITGIPPGHYNVRMGQAGVQMNGVDLNRDGDVDTSRAETLGSVKASVRIAGESALPPHLMVGLRTGHREAVAFQQVNAKGEAELEQVPAGKYEVLVWGSQKPYSITHMTASGGEVSGRTLAVLAGASASISLTLAGGSVEVQGTVKTAGKPFAGAMVVLVPKNPEVDRDLFRRDQSDLDGTFLLRGVIPGSYTMLAIQNGWDLDWSQPGVMAPYLKRGQTVEIGGRSGRPVNLPEIEVQSK